MRVSMMPFVFGAKRPDPTEMRLDSPPSRELMLHLARAQRQESRAGLLFGPVPMENPDGSGLGDCGA